MINKTLEKAINDQIKHEFDAAFLYLCMSAHFESENLGGFAHWMRLQYEEEAEHAMKLFDYLNKRGSRVLLQSFESPTTQFGKPVEIFQQILDHEREVSNLINNLYELAIKENDYPTQVELHWFINEQVEEEKTVEDILERLKMVGDSPTALLMMDRHLGRRGTER